jgi:hypothetical protein
VCVCMCAVVCLCMFVCLCVCCVAHRRVQNLEKKKEREARQAEEMHGVLNLTDIRISA